MKEIEKDLLQGRGLVWHMNNPDDVVPSKSLGNNEKVFTFIGGAQACRLLEEALKNYTSNALRTRRKH